MANAAKEDPVVEAPVTEAPTAESVQPPANPSLPGFISKEDCLAAENVVLKHRLKLSEIREAEALLTRLQNEEMQARQQVMVMQAGLTRKYKVDLANNTIRPDGSIGPRPS